ncbi:hypothetical protein PM082_020670 [Marasmius tenuissimus]|nr:hypothetical protein PM082_020670 [Marasmius tenuissimus]
MIGGPGQQPTSQSDFRFGRECLASDIRWALTDWNTMLVKALSRDSTGDCVNRRDGFFRVFEYQVPMREIIYDLPIVAIEALHPYRAHVIGEK